MKLPYQPAVYLVIRVPYGDVPQDDRDDVDERLLAAGTAIAGSHSGADAQVLDEHGVADWMHDVIKKGMVVDG